MLRCSTLGAVLPVLALALALLGAGGADAATPESAGEGDEIARYITFEPLVLSVIRHGRVVHQISLTVVLKASDREAMARIEALKPKLRDAYHRELYAYVSIPYPGNEVRFDAAHAKARIERQTRNVLGPDTVQEVLLTRVLDMPL